MNKRTWRVLGVVTLAIGSWGFAASSSPAQADQCNNEAAPGDVQIIPQEPVIGVDTGTAGAVGVVIVCVRDLNGNTITGAGGGYDLNTGHVVVCGPDRCSAII